MTESNLIIHANRELDKLGYPRPSRAQMRSKEWDGSYELQLRKSVMTIVEMFATQGHSGNSAGMVVSILHQLLQYKPLGPLTDDPEEWMQISEELAGGKNLWQNKRNSEAFSHDAGKTFYILSKKRWTWKPLTLIPRGKLRSWVWKHRSWMYKTFKSLPA